MGTRNLTAVVHGGKHRVAQYGQWDGHPNGQGVTALDFCRAHLRTQKGRARFAKQLDLCRFATEGEIEQLYRAEGIVDGWMNMAQANAFKKKHPTLDRDMAAEVLEHVWSAEDNVLLKDSYTFAEDSLFCEWAYVIDLDAGTFEVYEGFNQKPLAEGERFAAQEGVERGSATYYPVKLAAKWALDDLPSKTAFLETFNDEDEE